MNKIRKNTKIIAILNYPNIIFMNNNFFYLIKPIFTTNKKIRQFIISKNIKNVFFELLVQRVPFRVKFHYSQKSSKRVVESGLKIIITNQLFVKYILHSTFQINYFIIKYIIV